MQWKYAECYVPLCVRVSRKMLRVKSSKGWKKMHEKGRVLPHIRVLSVVCHMAPLFLPTSVRLSSHMTKVTTHVCVHVCVYSCTWVPCWLPWKWTIFFVVTYNKNEQPVSYQVEIFIRFHCGFSFRDINNILSIYMPLMKRMK